MKSLGEHRDFQSLTRVVLGWCEPYGAVHALRVVHNRGTSRVACSIELESTKQQPALARALGGRVVNGAVCLEIPVHKDFGSGAKVVPLPAAPLSAPAFDTRLAAVPRPAASPAVSSNLPR